MDFKEKAEKIVSVWYDGLPPESEQLSNLIEVVLIEAYNAGAKMAYEDVLKTMRQKPYHYMPTCDIYDAIAKKSRSLSLQEKKRL